MVERGLQPEFSRGAIAQAQAIPDPPPVGNGLRDLTSLLWCSIDNDDSRDLDELSVAERRADGLTIVRVAIADVDAMVPRGSPIDDHARTNTTSVYTPAQIFPMLPERLSTDLTSLVQDEPRAALVVEMHVADDGTVRDALIAQARVLNRAKLAYDAIAGWLDGDAPLPDRAAKIAGLDACLRLQDQIAQAMRQRRQRQGALSLESIQAGGVRWRSADRAAARPEESRQGVDRRLHDRGQRRDRAISRGARISSGPAYSADTETMEPDRRSRPRAWRGPARHA